MRPSTTKLSGMLVKFGAAMATFTARAVKAETVPMAKGFSLTNETYGRDSCLYLHCPDNEIRLRLEDALERQGVTTVYRRYAPNGNTIEVGVTFFKGWNWDE